MKYMVFDTETTGLPKDYKAKVSNIDNWPRIIQAAWIIYNEQENVEKVFKSLVIPDGWQVPKEKFWRDNGYNTEDCKKYGRPIKEILDEFVKDVQMVDLLISHNMHFDASVVGAEMFRLGISTGKHVEKVCTKEGSTDFCKLPLTWRSKTKKYKWPKLSELHIKLFNTDFEGAHDALADVKACGQCFFELKRRGIV